MTIRGMARVQEMVARIWKNPKVMIEWIDFKKGRTSVQSVRKILRQSQRLLTLKYLLLYIKIPILFKVLGFSLGAVFD